MEKSSNCLYIFWTRSNDADQDQTPQQMAADQAYLRLHKYCSIKILKRNMSLNNLRKEKVVRKVYSA